MAGALAAESDSRKMRRVGELKVEIVEMERSMAGAGQSLEEERGRGVLGRGLLRSERDSRKGSHRKWMVYRGHSNYSNSFPCLDD